VYLSNGLCLSALLPVHIDATHLPQFFQLAVHISLKVTVFYMELASFNYVYLSFPDIVHISLKVTVF